MRPSGPEFRLSHTLLRMRWLVLVGLLGSDVAWGDDREAFDAWATALPAAPQPTPTAANAYRFQASFWREIQAEIRAHPGLVQVEHLGQPGERRPMWAFTVRDPAEPVTRKVLVMAGLHALEWIGTEAALETLDWFVQHPEPGVQVTVVPLANPDGRAWVEHDLVAGRNVYRRANAEHVDLNRDFSVDRDAHAIWRGLLPGYYATSPGPLSQPESLAIAELEDRERFDRAASLHSFGGFLYYPWTGRWAAPPDEGRFEALGTAMEQAQGAHAYRTRQLSRWGFFFRAQGTEIDHLYGRYGTLAFLVELTRSGIDVTHPSTFHQYFRWYNPVDPTLDRELGFRAMRELVDHPTLPGEQATPPVAPG